MQIVIDIPEDRYKRIINDEDYMPLDISCAIKNGTPLPKGHGELVDKTMMLDAIKTRLQTALNNDEVILPEDIVEKRIDGWARSTGNHRSR